MKYKAREQVEIRAYVQEFDRGKIYISLCERVAVKPEPITGGVYKLTIESLPHPYEEGDTDLVVGMDPLDEE